MLSVACKTFTKPQTINLCRCFADRKLLPNDEKKLLNFNQKLELQSNQPSLLCGEKHSVNVSNCSESLTRLTYPWYSNEMLGNVAQEPYKPYGTIGCLCATRRYFWNNSPNPEGFVTYGPVNTRIYDAYQDEFLNNRWNLHTCEDRVNPNHPKYYKLMGIKKCCKCQSEKCRCGNNCKCEKCGEEKCKCKEEERKCKCQEEKCKCGEENCKCEEKKCCHEKKEEKCCKANKTEKCEKCNEEKEKCNCKESGKKEDIWSRIGNLFKSKK